MLNLSAGQQAIITSPVKTVSWLFDVTDRYLNRYYWSTKNVTISGGTVAWASGISWMTGVVWTDGTDSHGYVFKVIDFSGITLQRPKTETGIMAPSEFSFSITNKDNVYDPADFEDGYVKVSLAMSDGVLSEVIIQIWKFLIKKAEGEYQKIKFICEDFFQQYIEGDYPIMQYKIIGIATVWDTIDGIVWAAGIVWTDGSQGSLVSFGLKVHDVFYETSGVGNLSNYVCMPLPFGTCYVPVRSAYITDGRYYVLGPTIANGETVTYTISKVRSPRDYSVKAEYTQTFTQFTKNSNVGDDSYSFRVFQAALSAAPTNGLFARGDHYYDMPTQFSRSDTVAITNPADVIKYMLLGIGVDPLDIKDSTFTVAAATYTSWGLTFNGAFWKVVSREKALLSLLAQCHSTLVVAEQLELHVLNSASKQTITSTDVMKSQEIGPGSFKHTDLTRILADSGNVVYYPNTDVQDIGITYLMPAKTTKKYIDNEILDFPFVQTLVLTKKLARVYFQRKLLKDSKEQFTGKGTCLALQPSDFISISGDNYGGSHDVMVDSMAIKKDASIDFACIGFTDTIENYS